MRIRETMTCLKRCEGGEVATGFEELAQSWVAAGEKPSGYSGSIESRLTYK